MWLCLAVVAGGTVLGYSLGFQQARAQTLETQHRFDEYKLQVATDVNVENAAVVADIRALNKDLRRIVQSLQIQAAEDLTFSNNLQKDLQDANGKSCPLSPALSHYLDSLRSRPSAGVD